MSYDFAIEIDTGGDEPHHIEPYFADEHPALGRDGFAGTAVVTATGYARCGNYTSNVSGIWAKCLTAAMEKVPDARKWAGDDDRWAIKEYGPNNYKGEPRTVDTTTLHLRDLAGKECAAIMPLLRAAVEWGVEHIDVLHEFDPPNGWGDADGAVTYLWDIQRACEQHPNGKLYISS